MVDRTGSKDECQSLSEPKVFISYAQEDSERVRQLEQGLKSAGIKIWVAYRNIKPGQKTVRQICQGLDWCNFFILVWSKAAHHSTWVALEWENAVSLDKVVIPCLFDSTKVPAVLASTAYVDFQDFNYGFASLLNTLKSLSVN
jgi:hypothetical protein